MKLKIILLSQLAMTWVMIGLVGIATAAPPTDLPGSRGAEKAVEHSGRAFNREEALRQRREVHGWLLSEAVTQGRDTPISAVASEYEKLEIDQASQGAVPERVGVTKPLSISVSFGGVNLSHLNSRTLARPNGAMKRTTDGGYVFTSALSSPDATAVRVHFTGFRLAANAGLYLYTEDGQVFGPYTGRGPHGDGEFWSHTLMGDNVVLQLRHVGLPTSGDLHNTGFNIVGLAHIRPRFLGGFCSFNAPCIENAACVAPGPADAARDAVAHMQWVSGAFIYICTGGLLADTDHNTVIPYFLSANHCIRRGKDARNLENFFQLAETSCDTPTCGDLFDHRANHPQELRTLGATIKSTGRDTDYTLLELKEAAPVGSVFLGWNATPIALSDGAPLYRISHPGGAPQAYSEHRVDIDKGTCQGWPRGDRIYSHDMGGATEGGSSGSPVLNASSQVVGQLSGVCGINVGDTCDRDSNATVDGAFANYFNEISQFLDPGTSCTDQETNCSDGLDNDCDGLVDGLDPDCDDPGGGSPKGAACSVNSDCASNKCKGKTGSKTCK